MTVETATFANGFRVVSARMDAVETASLGVWVDVGARHEPAAVNGISHVLEHMAFKGTRRRSARDIAEAMDAVGGHLNAYTSHEHTAYYAKVLKEDVPLALDIVADILRDSVMDADELARERQVILQEIHHAHDTPDDVIFDHFQETAFPGQGLGRPVLGRAEIVGALDREAILGYMREHYAASRMVLAAAGRIDHDAIVRTAERLFADLPAGHRAADERAAYRGGEFREERDLEQVHLLLGFRGLPVVHPDYHALMVLTTILGGGMSSRLFQEVREKRGLSYSIYSYLAGYVDEGLVGIYAGTGEDEGAEVLEIVGRELDALSHAVGADELARAKAQFKAGLLMSLESTSARCEQIARQMIIFGRPIPNAETVAKVDAVDAAAVCRLAADLSESPPVLAAIGPLAGVPRLGEWKGVPA